MARVPLGRFAYRRDYAQEPEIRMVNRFFEQDPTNQVSANALLSRPGTTAMQTVGGGPIRALLTQSGAFNSDLFVVSANNVYRIAPDGTETAIAGTLSSESGPWMTITTGPGFEHLFVSDGDDLYIYEGVACARGTLQSVGSSPAISNGDVVRIGAVYYQFTTGDVDSGSPDGSESDPWLVALGTARASARLRFIASGPVVLDTAVFLGIIPEGTPSGEGGDLRHVYRGSREGELERNNPQGTGDNPWRLSFYRGQTPRSYLQLLKSAINATGRSGVDYSRALVDPHPLVQAGEVVGPNVPTDPSENWLVVRAIEGGEDGNDIQCRNVLQRADNIEWQDADGNPTQSLSGGSDSAADIPSALQNLSRAIDGSGIAGVDYSSNLTAHPNVETQLQEGSLLTVVSCDGESANAIATTTTSTGVAWQESTLTGGGEHRLDKVDMPDDVPAGSVATLGGFVTVSVRGRGRFYWLRPGERTVDPLNFATAESEPDAVVDTLTLADQLVLFGASTVEFWSVTGNPELPFRPSRGQTLNIGAVSGTPVRIKDSALFVGSDGVVYATAGGPVERISTNGIEERIREHLTGDGGEALIETWYFDQDGHSFFLMTFVEQGDG